MISSRSDSPLEVWTDDEEVHIRIGVSVLAVAAEVPLGQAVADHIEFARSIVAMLHEEEEDGTTPVHRLFDKAAEAAAEQGLDGLDYDENEDPDACPACNGPADNGHDRCIPPSPYLCTKCYEQYTPPNPGAGDSD